MSGSPTNMFMWFSGVVEDRNDPLRLGRVRVRIHSLHTDDKSDIPTSSLPWSAVVSPIHSATVDGIGTSPLGPVEGTHVIGFFRDGSNNQQDPIVVGVLTGIAEKRADNTKGFNDPRTESVVSTPASLSFTDDGTGTTVAEKGYKPLYPDMIGESDIHRLARGQSSGTVNDDKHRSRTIGQVGIPVAAELNSQIFAEINKKCEGSGNYGGVSGLFSVGGGDLISSVLSSPITSTFDPSIMSSLTNGMGGGLSQMLTSSLLPSLVGGPGAGALIGMLGDSNNPLASILPNVMQGGMLSTFSDLVTGPLNGQFTEGLIGNLSGFMPGALEGIMGGSGPLSGVLKDGLLSGVFGELTGELGSIMEGINLGDSSLAGLLDNPLVGQLINVAATSFFGPAGPFIAGAVIAMAQGGNPIEGAITAGLGNMLPGSGAGGLLSSFVSGPVANGISGPLASQLKLPIESLTGDIFSESLGSSILGEISGGSKDSLGGLGEQLLGFYEGESISSLVTGGIDIPSLPGGVEELTGAMDIALTDKVGEMLRTGTESAITGNMPKILEDGFYQLLDSTLGKSVSDPTLRNEVVTELSRAMEAATSKPFSEYISEDISKKLTPKLTSYISGLSANEVNRESSSAISDAVNNLLPSLISGGSGSTPPVNDAIGTNLASKIEAPLAESLGSPMKDAFNDFTEKMNNDPSGNPTDFLTDSLNDKLNIPSVQSAVKNAIPAAVCSAVQSVAATFSEPPVPYASKYPYNRVMQSESGHIEEWDDTPGGERYHKWHRAGTFEEIHPDGTRVIKMSGDGYRLALKDDHIHVEGHYKLTTDKGVKLFANKDASVGNNLDIQVGSGSNLNIRCDGGNVQLYVEGNFHSRINGNVVENITGNVCRVIGGNLTEIVNGQISRNSTGDHISTSEGSVAEIYERSYSMKIGDKYNINIGNDWYVRCGDDIDFHCDDMDVHD